MPTACCKICKRLHDMPHKRYKYLDRTGDFFCSLNCMKIAILDCVCPDELPAHMRNIQEDMGGDVWSMRFRVFFRSKFEDNFAGWLSDNGIDWEYETMTFSLGGVTTYTPDFYLPEYGVLIETKGVWLGCSRGKVKKYRELFNMPLLTGHWLLAKELPNGRT